MVAQQTLVRNGSRTHSEGRAKEDAQKRGHGHYKGRSPKAPAIVSRFNTLAGCLVEAAQRVDQRFEALLSLVREVSREVAALQGTEHAPVRLGFASGWVRVGCGRVIHVNSSDLLAAPPGD